MKLRVERYTSEPQCVLYPSATAEDFAAKFLDMEHGRTFPLGKPPLGTWFSVPSGLDWPEWCLREGFQVDGLAYRHAFELELAGERPVLHVDTLEALDAFHDEYSVGLAPGRLGGVLLRGLSMFYLNWPLIASRFGGIVIAPYQWQRRHDYLWYNTWDCASACVWDTSLLTHVSSEAYTPPPRDDSDDDE